MIEHSGFEVSEGDDQPERHHHDRPQTVSGPQEGATARDVILSALAVALPCPTCAKAEPCRCTHVAGDRTAQRADLILAALIEHGHLPDPEQSEESTPEQIAQWLASRTGFPRYTDVEDGWRRLLESEADVEVARSRPASGCPATRSTTSRPLGPRC